MIPLLRAPPVPDLLVALIVLAVGVLLARIVLRVAWKLLVLAALVVFAVWATTALLGPSPL
jgi:membrane-associated phospholipid phosphatase